MHLVRILFFFHNISFFFFVFFFNDYSCEDTYTLIYVDNKHVFEGFLLFYQVVFAPIISKQTKVIIIIIIIINNKCMHVFVDDKCTAYSV